MLANMREISDSSGINAIERSQDIVCVFTYTHTFHVVCLYANICEALSYLASNSGLARRSRWVKFEENGLDVTIFGIPKCPFIHKLAP